MDRRRRLLCLLGTSPLRPHSGNLRHRELIDRLAETDDVRLALLEAPAGPGGTGSTADGAEAWHRPIETVTVAPRSWHPSGLEPSAGAAALRQLICQSEPDVVIADKITAALIPRSEAVPVIVDFCDARSAHLRRRLRYQPGPRALAGLLRALALEDRAARRASTALFISPRDRDDAPHVLRLVPADAVIPNGVDGDYWRRNSPPGEDDGRPSIIFTGRMDYPPNTDAATQLARIVLPAVQRRHPGVRAVIAGADPPAAVRALAGPDVTVTGTVPDLRPLLERAAVFVAPLRFGAGAQNKLLEALAMDVPVVATELAAEGLRPMSGRTAPPITVRPVDAMAEAVVELLTTPRPRLPDGEPGQGRSFVVDNFSWAASAAALRRLIVDLAP